MEVVNCVFRPPSLSTHPPHSCGLHQQQQARKLQHAEYDAKHSMAPPLLARHRSDAGERVQTRERLPLRERVPTRELLPLRERLRMHMRAQLLEVRGAQHVVVCAQHAGVAHGRFLRFASSKSLFGLFRLFRLFGLYSK